MAPPNQKSSADSKSLIGRTAVKGCKLVNSHVIEKLVCSNLDTLEKRMTLLKHMSYPWNYGKSDYVYHPDISARTSEPPTLKAQNSRIYCTCKE